MTDEPQLPTVADLERFRDRLARVYEDLTSHAYGVDLGFLAPAVGPIDTLRRAKNWRDWRAKMYGRECADRLNFVPVEWMG